MRSWVLEISWVQTWSSDVGLEQICDSLKPRGAQKSCKNWEILTNQFLGIAWEPFEQIFIANPSLGHSDIRVYNAIWIYVWNSEHLGKKITFLNSNLVSVLTSMNLVQ